MSATTHFPAVAYIVADDEDYQTPTRSTADVRRRAAAGSFGRGLSSARRAQLLYARRRLAAGWAVFEPALAKRSRAGA